MKKTEKNTTNEFQDKYPSSFPSEGRNSTGPFLKNLIIPNEEIRMDEI